MQNPGYKAGTTMVLKGSQGIGKNVFTNVICELLSGYSSPNVNDLAEIAGEFNSVIEGKSLIVLNEMKNSGEDKTSSSDALKSVITEEDIRINEKCIPRRDGENAANFIIVTNHDWPVKIPIGDRRFFVFNCKGKYKNKDQFFKSLTNSFDTKFYEALTMFFLTRDISGFSPGGELPVTISRLVIIKKFSYSTDDWICDNYDRLCDDKEGITYDEIMFSLPYDLKTKPKNIPTFITRHLQRKRAGSGDRHYYYVLKKEYRDDLSYHQTIKTTDNSNNDYDEFL